MKKSIITLMAGIIFSSIIITCGLTLMKHQGKRAYDFGDMTSFVRYIRAEIIRENMNESADYCDDFYNYVCGNYVNREPRPVGYSMYSMLIELDAQVIKQLRKIIENEQPEDSKILTLAKNMYKNCMNEIEIEEQGETPLFNYLKQLGGWPVLKKNNEWNETLFNWKENIAQVSNKSNWIIDFFEFHLEIDIKNDTRRVITLTDYSSGISRKDLLKGSNDESVINYFNYMVNMSIELGAEKEYAEKELKEALEFEIKLSNLTRPLEDYRNQSLSYNPMTIGELAKQYTYFQWKKYLNHEFLYSNVSVDDDEIIIVNNPFYFDQLEKLINSTPKKIQANLIIWRKIQSMAEYMNEKIRKVYENYIKLTTGKIERTPRWVECTNIVSNTFSIATNALYIRRYFQNDSKDKVAVIVENIHNQFIKLLNNSSWMDAKTKLNAINKIKKMKYLIAYPDELLNNSKIDDYYKVYEDFEMIDSKYIENIISLRLFENRIEWSKLKQKYNPNEWINFAAKSSNVNAFYDTSANSIMLPAGILQSVFFSNKLPQYLNYGAIGTIIGHEIMHAFDDEGKQYDENGNVANWWTNTTNEKYKEKAQCVIDQYGNYIVEEINMNVNGINTQGENIADNGGIKSAYWAYNDWSNDNNKMEKKLPGFNFTFKQLFWISYANIWCSRSHHENQKFDINHSPHSPSEFRVNGPLSNLEEFSRDFGCPKGSKMNPEKKCTIW